MERGDVFGSLDMDKGKTFGIDEVRCYCNMAECITTGYMCKSQRLGCFSDLAAVTSPSSIEMVTHGCLDLLDKKLQTTCRNLPGKPDSSPLDTGAPKSLLLCCSEDMCNDVDIPGNHLHLNNQVFNSSNQLFLDKTAGRLRRPSLNSDTLIFRLATFAVPLLGAMILFMLVTLAVNLLRSDANEERMMAMKLRQNDAASLLLNKRHFPNSASNLNDFDTSSKKVPLLYQYDRTHLPTNHLGNRVNLLYPILPGHHDEKNKTNAKLNNVSAPYHTPGTNLEQPLLKINSGPHFQAIGYNSWGGVVANNLGPFCQDTSNISAALNQFVLSSNFGGCQMNTPLDNSSTSVDIGEDGPCCSSASLGVTSGNSDVTTPNNVVGTSDAASGVEGNVSATLGHVGITTPATNLADVMGVPARNGATGVTGGTTSGIVAGTSGILLETSGTCCDCLETKTNLPLSGCVSPCNRSSTTANNTPCNPQMSPNSPHNVIPGSLFGYGCIQCSNPHSFWTVCLCHNPGDFR
ncbi:uncharacterized protein LOC111044760 [Nilaparvata lugens]|uniref:uncharacterized protein LOC111044760 n=1 Tax=Nilaparvata lugens TaxID=108931 RepID=UPI00193DBA48|nr:uncharacterized protein LOC111044760 [Nilaparvata lugens]